MSEDKAKIFLDRVLNRIEIGEFDEHLSLPFASKKMLKILVEEKMQKKVETKSTPVISEKELFDLIDDIRETAAQTTATFIRVGILKENAKGIIPRYQISDKWAKFLNPPKATAKPE